MEKQYAPSTKDKKASKAIKTEEKYIPNKLEQEKIDKLKESVKSEDKKVENKIEVKEEKQEAKIEVKKEERKIEKKDKAIVNGNSLKISPKNSYAICRYIKGKSPDKAIEFLDDVTKLKKAVPMNGAEIPHRHGMMSGRYPVKTAQAFIELLKQLKANSSVNGIENPIITLAIANRASRPYKRGGARAKRANVYLEVKEQSELTLNKQKQAKGKGKK